MTELERELSGLPDLPGVYLMKDESGEVIYVGKAISLKKRVRSYFNSDKNKHPKVIAMVTRIASFEYITVDNEVEALVLESNLIKEKKPRYNILLRDDKTYPFIKLTKEKYPRLKKTRIVSNDGGKYFGPFPNAFAVTELIDLMHEIYPLRTCNLDFDKGAKLNRPCLNYHIGRCDAPCVGLADEAVYMGNIGVIEEFLKGKTDHLTDYLLKRMKECSEEQKYELAIKYRDYLSTIDTVMQKQVISKVAGKDIDMIALYDGEGATCIQLFYMRAGKVVDAQHFIVEMDYLESSAEIISSFMKQFYLDASYIPKEILVDSIPDDSEAIEKFLTQKRGNKVTIREPQRGDKLDLLKMVRQNAKLMYEKHVDKLKRRERGRPHGLEAFEQLLGLQRLNRIEAYDISNTSGVQSVGSMVVFIDGKKQTREYRKFKVKTVEGSDDYSSIKEVLERRLIRGLKEAESNSASGFGQLPDFIIVDGGLGHLNAAKGVMMKQNLNIPICGLAKDDSHNTRAIIYQGMEYPLKKNSAVYRFLYSIQEEAHRFAIEYHRKLRKKAMTDSILDEIPGVGPGRRVELLKRFGSVDAMRNASLEDLEAVPKINRSIAKEIIEFFKKGEVKM